MVDYEDQIGDMMKRVMERWIKITGAQRERILEAFIAETGCLPSECLMVEQRTDDGVVWYVTKRADFERDQKARAK